MSSLSSKLAFNEETNLLAMRSALKLSLILCITAWTASLVCSAAPSKPDVRAQSFGGSTDPRLTQEAVTLDYDDFLALDGKHLLFVASRALVLAIMLGKQLQLCEIISASPCKCYGALLEASIRRI